MINKMKVFTHDAFVQLLSRENTVIKLPEQHFGFYFLIIFYLNEKATGIGEDEVEFQQNWELTNYVKIDNLLHFVFKMWGQLPGNLKIEKDISQHEGKEFAVPANTIIGVLNNLARQDPLHFSLANLQKTQILNKFIRPAK